METEPLEPLINWRFATSNWAIFRVSKLTMSSSEKIVRLEVGSLSEIEMAPFKKIPFSGRKTHPQSLTAWTW